MIKLTPSLWMEARAVNASVIFLNINDVVISLFASDKGCLMHMNGLPGQRGVGGLLEGTE